MATVDQLIAEKIQSWYVGEWPLGNLLLCVIALFLAVVLCGAIGYEREKRGRTAGLRTHLLVGVGSALVMIISIYGFPTVFSRDVARLAAQVITGVGFLGAGAIIHRNSGTRGLTTAATIWLVMAIGLACGSFNFILAVGTTVLIIIVLTLFRGVEKSMMRKNPMFSIRTSGEKPIFQTFLTICKDNDCSIHDLRTELLEDGTVDVTFCLVIESESISATEMLAKFEGIDGVKGVVILSKSTH